MKRLELFEFEDFQWLPNVIRAGITRLIMVFHRLMGTTGVIAHTLSELRTQLHFTQIIDLGSGSGGPMIDVIQKINSENQNQKPLELWLSDKYPDSETVHRINQGKWPHVRYMEKSVDASQLDQLPAGLKTMMASFHHMSPDTATDILASAAKSKEPIFIYELAENNIPFWVWCLFLPVSLIILVMMSLFMTPFVRPLTWPQVVLTYLIPVIPIIYAWDGQASLMRTYTFEDIKTLLPLSENESYKWQLCPVKNKNGRKAGYYILGFPE